MDKDDITLFLVELSEMGYDPVSIETLYTPAVRDVDLNFIREIAVDDFDAGMDRILRCG